MSETHASSILKNLYATANGSANTYKAYLPSIDSLQEGLFVNLKINVDNTEASTLDINSFGAKSIKGPDGTDLSAGDLSMDRVVSLVYNGSEFQILAAGTTNSSMSSVDDATNKNTSNHFRTLDILQSQHAGATIIESGWVDSFGNANEIGADETNSTGESHDNVNKLYEGSTGSTNQNSDRDYTTESNYLEQEWTNSNQNTSQATVASGTTVTLSSGVWPTNAENARISFDSGTTFFDIDSRDSNTQLTLATSATNATSDYIIRMSEFDTGTVQLNGNGASPTTLTISASGGTMTGGGTGWNGTFGKSGSYPKIAQIILSNVTGTITEVKAFIKKVNNPTLNYSCTIYAVTGSSGSELPTGSAIATSNELVGSSLTTSFVQKTFTFSSPASVTNGTKYAVVFESPGTLDSTNYYVVDGANSSVYGDGHSAHLIDGVGGWELSTGSHASNGQEIGIVVTFGGISYPVNEYVSLVDIFTQKEDTSSWSDINSASSAETLNSQNAYYWLSYDPATSYGAGTEVKIFNQSGSVWRNIARNNGGVWQYNNDATSTATENWINTTTNDMLHAVSQAMSSQANNRMTGADLAAITDVEWEAANGFSISTNALARGVTLHSTSSSQNPSVDQYRINYDSDNVAMDLRSKTFDPGSSPASAFIWAQVEHTDADGVGTFSISRNGGSNWETVSMIQQGEAISGDVRILRSVHTFTTGSGGEDLRVRYVTEAGKSQKLHAWGLQARD
jgi:hypothetical protein